MEISLQERSGKELGELLAQKPEEFLLKWRDLKHLHPVITNHVPPYAIK